MTADLVVANAGLLVTMDHDGREHPGGWVAIEGGFVTGVGDSTTPDAVP